MIDADSRPQAGRDLPWEYIAGYYLLLHEFRAFASLGGDTLHRLPFGILGLAVVELPNPDVSSEQRLLGLPIEDESDFKSLYRAFIDAGVRDGSNELVLVYERRRGLFGGKRASIHVGCFRAGTWTKFFEAVTQYAPQSFRWPGALFKYQPSSNAVFRSKNNLFQP